MTSRRIAVTGAFAAILLAAAFTRFYRLGEPDQCYFDEVYFPTTGAEILRGDNGDRANNHAWDFFGHENTHPPLSKELMAVGMAIFGHQDRAGVDNHCWPDAADAAKKNDPNWIYDPVGWRFFGALAGVGAVVFIYLIAKKLFQSEVASLTAAFLLTFEGLAFVQSRIATPDAYVLFFLLGAVYFLLSGRLSVSRLAISGVFFGAALASKWVAALAIVPILLYFAWTVVQHLRDSDRDERLWMIEAVIVAGLAVIAAGFCMTAILTLFTGDLYLDAMVISVMGALAIGGALIAIALSREARNTPLGKMIDAVIVVGLVVVAVGVGRTAIIWLARFNLEGPIPFPWDAMVIPIIGALVIFGALIPIALAREARNTRGRLYLRVGVAVPLCFVLVPLSLYALTYVPMLLDGHDINDALRLNKDAYDFHSSLEATHSYQSSWWQWPIIARPIFLYVEGFAKIYSMGNPVIFWLGLPALAFVLYQGLRNVRIQHDEAAGALSISGTLTRADAALLFVGLSYLGFWLPWAINPRALFLYHYLPALMFLILALAYCVQWLWHREEAWGRIVAMVFLATVAITFGYFYPHMAAVDVSREFDDSYYWFPNNVSEFVGESFLGKDNFMNWR